MSRNAAGIPEPLLESELCGNIAGYPQATMPARPGMFDLADGGMMFLDEIGEMARDLQALLLRVMDAGEYWRLGDSKARRSDFRMVCATNARLEDLKTDFLPRLKRVVELPSLRERREDIPLLVRAFAEKHVAVLEKEKRKRFMETRPDGTEQVRIGIDLIDALMVSNLPTNVRGLEILVLDSILRSKGYTLRAWPELWKGTRRHAQRNQRNLVRPSGRVRELRHEDVAELRKLIGSGHGAISRAAKVLWMSRYQVKRLMERYGIKTDDPEDPDEGE